MKIRSPAFHDGGTMPERFSQYRENVSPPIDFAELPERTRSLVLIMDDPDAPRGTYTHWVAYNIDPDAPHVVENATNHGMQFARNDAGKASYAGPKPPSGEHRYFFHAYALDDRLTLPVGVGRPEVERAMHGHILAEAEFMGRYAKPV